MLERWRDWGAERCGAGEGARRGERIHSDSVSERHGHAGGTEGRSRFVPDGRTGARRGISAAKVGIKPAHLGGLHGGARGGGGAVPAARIWTDAIKSALGSGMKTILSFGLLRKRREFGVKRLVKS